MMSSLRRNPRASGFGVLPARPYKPRDKAVVENAVQVAQRWIIAALRHQKFFSLEEANLAIGELLHWRNGNERPLANLRFDGSVLEFQMEPGTPMFRMTVANDQFEGYSISPSAETLRPKLKMIKYVGL
jgi:hypothetical protein